MGYDAADGMTARALPGRKDAQEIPDLMLAAGARA